MSQPISISALLWNHQVSRPVNSTITHGKGRRGVIIRSRRMSRLSRIRSVFSRGQK